MFAVTNQIFLTGSQDIYNHVCGEQNQFFSMEGSSQTK